MQASNSTNSIDFNDFKKEFIGERYGFSVNCNNCNKSKDFSETPLKNCVSCKKSFTPLLMVVGGIPNYDKNGEIIEVQEHADRKIFMEKLDKDRIEKFENQNSTRKEYLEKVSKFGIRVYDKSENGKIEYIDKNRFTFNEKDNEPIKTLNDILKERDMLKSIKKPRYKIEKINENDINDIINERSIQNNKIETIKNKERIDIGFWTKFMPDVPDASVHNIMPWEKDYSKNVPIENSSTKTKLETTNWLKN